MAGKKIVSRTTTVKATHCGFRRATETQLGDWELLISCSAVIFPAVAVQGVLDGVGCLVIAYPGFRSHLSNERTVVAFWNS
jgi:hypothetical protein